MIPITGLTEFGVYCIPAMAPFSILRDLHPFFRCNLKLMHEIPVWSIVMSAPDHSLLQLLGNQPSTGQRNPSQLWITPAGNMQLRRSRPTCWPSWNLRETATCWDVCSRLWYWFSVIITQLLDLPVKIFVLALKECIQSVFVLWRELVRAILLEPKTWLKSQRRQNWPFKNNTCGNITPLITFPFHSLHIISFAFTVKILADWNQEATIKKAVRAPVWQQWQAARQDMDV